MLRSEVRTAGIYIRDMVIVLLVAAIGSGLGLALYGRTSALAVSLFAGPTYLFFILAGLGVGYVLNRYHGSKASRWVWILPTIWSGYAGAHDMASRQEDLIGYIWNTLILGKRELALISQWAIGAPCISALAYSFGAWLTLRNHFRRVQSGEAPAMHSGQTES